MKLCENSNVMLQSPCALNMGQWLHLHRFEGILNVEISLPTMAKRINLMFLRQDLKYIVDTLSLTVMGLKQRNAVPYLARRKALYECQNYCLCTCALTFLEHYSL